ncbi:MAG: LuxR C-terminal-related transcriptional regulator [Chitinophagaceae bacterium]
METVGVIILSNNIQLTGRLLVNINEVEGFSCSKIHTSVEDVLLTNVKAEIIIIDSDLIKKEWKHAIHTVIHKNPASSIILYSENFDTELIIESMRLGVVGYLDERQIINGMSEVLVAVIMTGGFISQKVAKKILDYFHQPNIYSSLLTNRELEVAYFINEGFTYRQIAQRCDISIDTVRMHIRNIYRKLKVKSKIQLINNMKTNNDLHYGIA